MMTGPRSPMLRGAWVTSADWTWRVPGPNPAGDQSELGDDAHEHDGETGSTPPYERLEGDGSGPWAPSRGSGFYLAPQSMLRGANGNVAIRVRWLPSGRIL